MSHNIKIIARVKNGELAQCMGCHNYHLIFNNILFEFNSEELEQFKNYIFMLDIDYWELHCPYSKINKKVPIPSLQKNLTLLFNREEIEVLKKLLSKNSSQDFKELKPDEIDYTLIFN